MELVEIEEAVDAAARGDPDAQQRFHALEFAAPLGSRAMKLLAQRFQSLAELGFAHVKRMKKHPELPATLLALAAPFADGDDDIEPSSAALADALREAAELLQARVTSALALKHAPTSREAFERHTRAWPLIFHASALPVAQAEPVGDDEVLVMRSQMRAAIAVAQQFARATDVSALPFCCAHGCVVVDPSTSQVVADSTARATEPSLGFLPLFHPVMLAIDGVAERDRRRSAAARLRKRQRRDEVVNEGKRERDADDGDADLQQRRDEGSEAQADEAETYLCTGYDVFVDREPCVMCAMALVHSRAHRVVFATLNPTDGALASAHRLHTIKSLNHHYRVFHLRLEDGSAGAGAGCG